MTLLAVIGDSDRRRYLDLGAREEATLVIGNPKFDSLIEVAKLAQKKTERPLGRQIVVAGSTEDREELLIVQSWLTQAEKPHLILAPRHLGRLTQITSFLSEMPLSFRLLSARPDFDWPTEPDVVVVDAYGALAKLYALADLAIVGGGFYAGQGHNPLEPAAFGVPILFGPHMSSFEGDCQELVAAGAARRATPSELPGALAEWLTQGSSALAGLAGRELLARRAPVGPRLAALVGRALSVPLP
jgi:3-deoxy-D-manno-octulosonic-acid transferase